MAVKPHRLCTVVVSAAPSRRLLRGAARDSTVSWGVRLLGAALAVQLAAGATGAAPQAGGGGFDAGAPPPKKEEEYVRPKEALEPLPEPLSASEEKARERAKERGVLVSDRPQSGVISEVRIEGARKVEPDAVLVLVQSRIDKKPDRRVLQADVRRIWGMDIFDDVTVEARQGAADSIILTFRLKEKPAVDEVLLEGNKEVTKEDIDEVIDIKPFQVLDVAKIRVNEQKIQKLYVDKGFFLAAVTSEVRPSTGTSTKAATPGLLDVLTPREQDPDRAQKDAADKELARPVDQGEGEFVDVVFKITEAAKVKIENITFVGNEKVPADDLRSFLRTHEAHPLGIFNEWGTYKEEAADIDLMAIEQIYQDRGFINVRVGKPRVMLSADKTRISMAIPITEGDAYRLKSFDVSGDLIVDAPPPAGDPADGTITFTKADLVGRTATKAGDLWSRTQIAMDVNAIADRYRDRGYAYVDIVPDTVPHESEKALDLILKVQAGPRVKVERIDITGNNKTQDSVIRRELRVYEGEYYSASQLRLSEQRVNALGFFEKVNVTNKPGSAPDLMTLVIDVKEKSTGTFQVGAGFSNAENILITGQISYNNFLGTGTTVSASLQWSGARRIFDLRFLDPYVKCLNLFGTKVGCLPDPLTVGFSAFNTSRYFLDYNRNSTGADATLGYTIGKPLVPLTRALLSDASPAVLPYVPDFENLQLFVVGNVERVEIDEASFSVRLLSLQTNLPRWTTSVRTSIVFDQRNNRLFPSAGWLATLGVELATPVLGAQLLPGAEAALKDALADAGVKSGLGVLKRNGLANDFQRYTLTLRAYMNFDQWLPLKGMVLKSNVEMGVINSSSPLVFENYYMGGFNTIRGYYLRSISPVARVGSALDPSSPLQEFRTGGAKQLFTNLELEFPILEQVGIRGVLFADAGNTYSGNENFFYAGNGRNPDVTAGGCGPTRACWDPRTQLPLGLYYAVGMGLRWFSPIGPLRFELGFPLTPRPIGTFGFPQGDTPYQFEFNVGNSF